jgi:hypothetical protein
MDSALADRASIVVFFQLLLMLRIGAPGRTAASLRGHR